nr:hypothetical protein [Rugamonas rivuli]
MNVSIQYCRISRLAIKETHYTLLIDGIKDMPHPAASHTKHYPSRPRTSRRQHFDHFADSARLTKLRAKKFFEYVDPTGSTKQGRRTVASQRRISCD